MRIKQISVSGLFGIFDHVIPLNEERITIIHGPNGFGKTAVLRLLDALFNSQPSKLISTPFREFQIDFDSGSTIKIIKENVDVDITDRLSNITMNFYEAGKLKDSFTPKEQKDFSSLYAYAYYLRQQTERIEADQTIRIENSSRAASMDGVEDVIWRMDREVKLESEPEWLKSTRDKIHIRLIESQRLLSLSSDSSFKEEQETSEMLHTVSAYSNELAQLMRSKFTEYGATSQALDRTFPVRAVKQLAVPDFSDEQLRHQLNELEKVRAHLIEVGLLNKDEDPDFQIQPETIDESSRHILSVYIEDVKKKLSIFDDVAKKIDLLRRIINNKFSHKQISFSKEQGFNFTTQKNYSLLPNATVLSPTDLSSGEQHELVLFYELLFKVHPNSLVLIDEPELSLHVGWQTQFLKDLQEITTLVDSDILMATHSPDIIQDRWDLTVELKDVV